jgi:hypothetical protein
MNHAIIRQRLVLASAILLTGVAAGYATVVTPLSTSDPISTDGSHGLLVGHIRLAWHGTDTSEGRTEPLSMKWSIEEETRGKHFLITDLPTQGAFVLKLPARSHHVKSIRFDSRWGIWHTVLPTTLQVQSGGCTSLGTWEFQRELELFPGWITGHIFKELESTHVELQQILATQDCSALAESTTRTKLGFQHRLGDSKL